MNRRSDVGKVHIAKVSQRAVLTVLFLAVAACSDRGEQASATNSPAPAAEDAAPVAETTAEAPTVSVSEFGEMPDGTVIEQFTLRNDQGIEAKIITYGGIITSLKAPDREGNLADVVLGFDSLQPYLEGTPYFGAIIGRYGNRIAGGKFTLDGKEYQLATNDGPNHLHGGEQGFDKKVWAAESFTNDTGAGVELTLVSPDGDQGYPGNLTVTATYTLTKDNELMLDFHAVTDKATPVNLTQHTYFNLAAEGTILDHRLMIDAKAFTPIDETLIPTGEVRSVEGTPFDFMQPVPIGARIDADNQQLAYGQGYDHNFILDKSEPGAMELAARVVEPDSGRVLEVYTEEPAIQFYSGNFLDGSLEGKGRIYEYRSGLCLEPQHYPDSPNQPDFPSTILRPGEEYSTRMSYVFSTDK